MHVTIINKETINLGRRDIQKDWEEGVMKSSEPLKLKMSDMLKGGRLFALAAQN